jgi:site-specific recombinase XerD
LPNRETWPFYCASLYLHLAQDLLRLAARLMERAMEGWVSSHHDMSRDPLHHRLGPRLRSFFEDYLRQQRGLSENTVRSYRDAWKLLLDFGARSRGLGPAQDWLKTVGHLEVDELEEVFRSVKLDCERAYRDLALLCFAYNTGARAQEIASARRRDLGAGPSPCIRIRGKGGREREVPLWEGTLRVLGQYLRDHRPQARDAFHGSHLFLGVRGRALTRFQVRRILVGYFRQAAERKPSLRRKRLTAHSMRHTTAVHLLQSGAEANVIRTWLGHASIESSQVYLDLDLAPRRAILERLITPQFAALCLGQTEPRQDEGDLMEWLESL